MAAAITFEAIKSLMRRHKLQNCSDGTLSIKEKDGKATLRSVHIDGIGTTAFSIAYDECKFPGDALLAKRTSREVHNNTSPEAALFIPTHTGAKNYVRQLLGKPL